MTRGQEKSSAMLARLVWGRTLDVDEDVTVLGDVSVGAESVIATVVTPSSDRFLVVVRHLGDRRIRA